MEPEFTHSDGTVRKNHYGDGEQPWDTIKALGWAPWFCACNVIKYLRRTKDVDDSRRKAKWYFAELLKHPGRDSAVLYSLIGQLTHEEWAFIAPLATCEICDSRAACFTSAFPCQLSGEFMDGRSRT